MKRKTIRNLVIVLLISILVSNIILGIAAFELGITFPTGPAIGVYNTLVSLMDFVTVILAIWVFVKSER